MNDRDLADLLGDAPPTPDPRFRLDVLSRVARRARQFAAAERAVRTIGAFTAIGVFFPLAQALGLTLADMQPLFMAAAIVGVAYLFAKAMARGPRGVLLALRMR